MKLTRKDFKIISLSLFSWGLMFVGTGYYLTTQIRIPTTTNKVEIIQKRVAEIKSNEIKLKDLEIEINTPISVDVKDYLNDIKNLDQRVIEALKLDTSNVKVTEPGSYTYTITYEKKTYNGTIKVKEKELPDVDITVIDLTLLKGSALSTDKQVYIKQKLTNEVKNNIILDLRKVDTQKAGIYEYTITYKNTLYPGKITVIEPQEKEDVLTPDNGTGDDTGDEEKPKEDEETTNA